MKPEYSVVSGLAVGGLVVAIHANATPTMADIQSLPAGQPEIAQQEKKATWMCVGIVSIVSLLAKDPTIFVIGALTTAGMSLATKHANWATPGAGGGKFLSPSEAAQAGSANTGPVMADTEPTEMFANSGSDFDR